MYTGYGFRTSEIGDVDVIVEDGVYHLFHLVLPNHDYIAHAVSEDGFAWRRVENALFIGDPGSWDDDMLWTMHVRRDRDGRGFEMFYTGLAMRERGRVQRIGIARSDDLYSWTKVERDDLPIEADPEHYEASLDEGRRWVSFRDPYVFEHDGKRYLLAAARVPHGPVIRRGCAALLREEPNGAGFVALPPLYHPRRYDDLEVPNLFGLDGRWYLIGSIREDIKVHYWVADEPFGPFRNYTDNVLLPQGNYAARVSLDGGRPLVWNFFYEGSRGEGSHLLPPPKELHADDDGHLYLRSFGGFDARVTDRRRGPSEVEPLFGPRDDGRSEATSTGCRLEQESGFEAFLLPGRYRHVRISGTIGSETNGKLGLVARLDEAEASRGDGYYLSLDLGKGIAQIRAWAHGDGDDPEAAFRYHQLQAAHAVPRRGPHPFVLVAYGSYLEFSLHGRVLLSLSDGTFRKGRFGFYLESGRLSVDDLVIETLRCHEDEPGAVDWFDHPDR